MSGPPPPSRDRTRFAQGTRPIPRRPRPPQCLPPRQNHGPPPPPPPPPPAPPRSFGRHGGPGGFAPPLRRGPGGQGGPSGQGFSQHQQHHPPHHNGPEHRPPPPPRPVTPPPPLGFHTGHGPHGRQRQMGPPPHPPHPPHFVRGGVPPRGFDGSGLGPGHEPIHVPRGGGAVGPGPGTGGGVCPPLGQSQGQNMGPGPGPRPGPRPGPVSRAGARPGARPGAIPGLRPGLGPGPRQGLGFGSTGVQPATSRSEHVRGLDRVETGVLGSAQEHSNSPHPSPSPFAKWRGAPVGGAKAPPPPPPPPRYLFHRQPTPSQGPDSSSGAPARQGKEETSSGSAARALHSSGEKSGKPVSSSPPPSPSNVPPPQRSRVESVPDKSMDFEMLESKACAFSEVPSPQASTDGGEDKQTKLRDSAVPAFPDCAAQTPDAAASTEMSNAAPSQSPAALNLIIPKPLRSVLPKAVLNGAPSVSRPRTPFGIPLSRPASELVGSSSHSQALKSPQLRSAPAGSPRLVTADHVALLRRLSNVEASLNGVSRQMYIRELEEQFSGKCVSGIDCDERKPGLKSDDMVEKGFNYEKAETGTEMEVERSSRASKSVPDDIENARSLAIAVAKRFAEKREGLVEPVVRERPAEAEILVDILARNRSRAAAANAALRRICSDREHGLDASLDDVPAIEASVPESVAFAVREAILNQRQEQSAHRRSLAKQYTEYLAVWRKRTKQGRDKRSREKREMCKERDRFLFRSIHGENSLLSLRTSSGRTSTKVLAGVTSGGTSLVNISAEVDAALAEYDAAGGTPGAEANWSRTLAELPTQNPDSPPIDCGSVLIEDPVAMYVNACTVNPWSREETLIFLEKFIVYQKDFRRIATYVTHKSTADVVRFYYENKLRLNLKQISMKRRSTKRAHLLSLAGLRRLPETSKYRLGGSTGSPTLLADSRSPRLTGTRRNGIEIAHSDDPLDPLDSGSQQSEPARSPKRRHSLASAPPLKRLRAQHRRAMLLDSEDSGAASEDPGRKNGQEAVDPYVKESPDVAGRDVSKGDSDDSCLHQGLLVGLHDEDSGSSGLDEGHGVINHSDDSKTRAANREEITDESASDEMETEPDVIGEPREGRDQLNNADERFATNARATSKSIGGAHTEIISSASCVQKAKSLLHDSSPVTGTPKGSSSSVGVPNATFDESGAAKVRFGDNGVEKNEANDQTHSNGVGDETKKGGAKTNDAVDPSGKASLAEVASGRSRGITVEAEAAPKEKHRAPKSRAVWTPEEQTLFKELYESNGRNWRKVAAVMLTKTPAQIKGYWRRFDDVYKDQGSDVARQMERHKPASVALAGDEETGTVKTSVVAQESAATVDQSACSPRIPDARSNAPSRIEAAEEKLQSRDSCESGRQSTGPQRAPTSTLGESEASPNVDRAVAGIEKDAKALDLPSARSGSPHQSSKASVPEKDTTTEVELIGGKQACLQDDDDVYVSGHARSAAMEGKQAVADRESATDPANTEIKSFEEVPNVPTEENKAVSKSSSQQVLAKPLSLRGEAATIVPRGSASLPVASSGYSKESQTLSRSASSLVPKFRSAPSPSAAAIPKPPLSATLSVSRPDGLARIPLSAPPPLGIVARSGLSSSPAASAPRTPGSSRLQDIVNRARAGGFISEASRAVSGETKPAPSPLLAVPKPNTNREEGKLKK